MENKPRLHIQRFREARGQGAFFDPNTDIRRLVPMVLGQVLSSLIETVDLQELRDDLVYLDSCFRVWEIRLLEDPAPANTQLREFLRALVAVDPRVTMLVFRHFATAMMLVYSLFVRRDTATDGKDLHAMLEQTRLAPLEELLSTECFAGVKNELSRSGATLLHESGSQCDVYAKIQETGEELHNLKEIARMCVQSSEDTPWDVLSQLCDAEFQKSRHPDGTQIALGLAYPSYRNPTLVLEADSEPEGKAGKSGEEQEPGPV